MRGTMTREDEELEALKAQMTDQQRKDIAEIIQAEVQRRERMKLQSGARPSEKSGVKGSGLGRGLGSEHLGELYSGIDDKVRALRLQKIDQKIAETRGMARQVRATGRMVSPLRGLGGILSRISGRNALLLLGIVILGVLKIGVATGVVQASVKGAPTPAEIVSAAVHSSADEKATENVMVTPNERLEKASNGSQGATAVVLGEGLDVDRKLVGWSASEKQILTELDARRVELEKRRQALDKREAELKNQSQALAERLAELKTLNIRLGQVRKEHDNQYDARMENLANVYSGMAPNEAAPLLAKLDEETALALLKRMPSKRMGQILSLMDAERAVELTKILSDKSKTDEVPAQ